VLLHALPVLFRDTRKGRTGGRERGCAEVTRAVRESCRARAKPGRSGWGRSRVYNFRLQHLIVLVYRMERVRVRRRGGLERDGARLRVCRALKRQRKNTCSVSEPGEMSQARCCSIPWMSRAARRRSGAKTRACAGTRDEHGVALPSRHMVGDGRGGRTERRARVHSRESRSRRA
jgi:hypothetical protein